MILKIIHWFFDVALSDPLLVRKIRVAVRSDEVESVFIRHDSGSPDYDLLEGGLFGGGSDISSQGDR